jgi:hypothetical protein
VHGSGDDPDLLTLTRLPNVNQHDVPTSQLLRNRPRRQVLDLASRRRHHLYCSQHMSSFDACDRASKETAGHP